MTRGSILRELSPPVDGCRFVALRYRAGHYLAPHRHDEPYVSVLVNGRYTEVCNAMPRRCIVGTIIAHEPGEEHADYFPTDGICINISHVDDAVDYANDIEATLRTRRPRDWREAFDVITNVERHPSPAVAQPKSAVPLWLQRLLRDFDWTGNAPLRVAAERGDVHPAHLARAFRRYLGITACAYRRRARIAAAAARLLTTSASLAEIVTDAGFYDQSDFTHRFIEASGMPPGRHRSIFRR